MAENGEETSPLSSLTTLSGSESCAAFPVLISSLKQKENNAGYRQCDTYSLSLSILESYQGYEVLCFIEPRIMKSCLQMPKLKRVGESG